MSFLTGFMTTLHAIEAGAKIAAPFIATVNPVIGALVMQGATAAVGIEGVITAPGNGLQKAKIVASQTEATVKLVNSALVAQGKPPLPDNTTDQVNAQVKVVVDGLNAVAAAAPAL